MSLRKYFKPASALPTLEKTGLSTHATAKANKAVERTIQSERKTKSAGTKRTYTSTFIPEDRAAIGKYAAENGNMRASKKYCVAKSTERMLSPLVHRASETAATVKW